ncbi:TIGR02444 family protein [Phenylobacterium sp.]|uniref:TIGR02444 family protein n=1 Tax=Phenylobacterium sp. TaxID=1871053 RepID=UPI00391D3FEE
MGIWDWALEAYGRPGVPEACLALQDGHGQNTCLLLWAVWAEARDPALLVRAAGLARAWESAAVGPLRAVRRGLKAPVADIADAARERLREDVKAVELHAERVLLEALADLGGRFGGAPALPALEAASAAWGRTAPRQALAALAAALE